MQVRELSSKSLLSWLLPFLSSLFLTIAQVPVVKVTVRLGPVNTAGTSIDALKYGVEQYLYSHQDVQLRREMQYDHSIDAVSTTAGWPAYARVL